MVLFSAQNVICLFLLLAAAILLVSGLVSVELRGEHSAASWGGFWAPHFCRRLPKEQEVVPSLLEHGPSAFGSGIRGQGDLWGPTHPENSLLSHYLPTLTCQQHSQLLWIF